MTDSDAFLFSIDKNTKYPVKDDSGASRPHARGFEFGELALYVSTDGNLNDQNKGYSKLKNYYNMQADENGNSPLTGVNGNFTVAELEVY